VVQLSVNMVEACWTSKVSQTSLVEGQCGCDREERRWQSSYCTNGISRDCTQRVRRCLRQLSIWTMSMQ